MVTNISTESILQGVLHQLKLLSMSMAVTKCGIPTISVKGKHYIPCTLYTEPMKTICKQLNMSYHRYAVKQGYVNYY